MGGWGLYYWEWRLLRCLCVVDAPCRAAQRCAALRWTYSLESQSAPLKCSLPRVPKSKAQVMLIKNRDLTGADRHSVGAKPSAINVSEQRNTS